MKSPVVMIAVFLVVACAPAGEDAEQTAEPQAQESPAEVVASSPDPNEEVALSQELLALSWDTTAPLSGTAGKDGILVVTNDTGAPMTAALAEIQDPGITASWYVVHGTVSYEGVGGIGFLEMWSVFPDGSGYFSRGLADFGPLRRITGSSKWREFGLPFSLGDSTERPEVLTINLVLPEAGTVQIGPLRLVQYDSEESFQRALAAAAVAR